MSDCAHDRGYRVANGRVFCGTCNQNAILPATWVKGPENIDYGEVSATTAATVLGMLCQTSNWMAANRLMILAEERFALCGRHASQIVVT